MAASSVGCPKEIGDIVNVKRFLSIFSMIIFLSIIIFNFQNCAAPNGDGTESLSSEGAEVGFVDDLVNKKLAFVESLIVTKHDENTINFDGLCDRESHGKTVDWVIEDVSTRSVAQEGSSECIRGGFRITSDQMNDLSCNTDYDLVAAVDEAHDDVIIRKKCKPASAIEDGSDENNNGYGKECFFELESKDESSVCHRVCYGSGKLYSREVAPGNKCSRE